MSGQLSQASPTPSPSASAWPGLGVSGQLSTTSSTPSPSLSNTQASQRAVLLLEKSVTHTSGGTLPSMAVTPELKEPALQ